MTIQTGLIFPSNGSPSTQFRFTGGNLLSPFPATYIWRRTVVQQNGYYTTFFWGPGTSFNGVGYYGAHPYPITPPSSSDHQWEVSVEGGDPPWPSNLDTNGNSCTVNYGPWYTQALIVKQVTGAELQLDFYYNLPNTSYIISYTTTSGSYANTFPPSNPALTFGDAPWNETNEELSGIFRGLQIYSTNMTLSEVLTESANQNLNVPQTATGLGSVWYMSQNPTPTDISDKSGAGHDPAWFNANRPSLYSVVVPNAATTAYLPMGQRKLYLPNQKAIIH